MVWLCCGDENSPGIQEISFKVSISTTSFQVIAHLGHKLRIEFPETVALNKRSEIHDTQIMKAQNHELQVVSCVGKRLSTGLVVSYFCLLRQVPHK